MNHTPGPWRVECDNDETWIESDSQTICTFVSNCDARLIAAAPDLFSFVQEWLDRQGTDENYMTAKARAIISKATNA